ncbi:MAG: SGNH/GDSL hydrolase family protein [Bacteroidaceae bacterium]|nr:SGNH/GDSL hydrolase family protein [Bacteroidaceae bacterium]
MNRIVLGLFLSVISLTSRAEGTAMLISDNRQVETSWEWCFTDESLGLSIRRITSCYNCTLTSANGMSADVARILSSKNIAETAPDVIFLQLGCNDSPDSDEQHAAYESSLFDYPYGKVCNLAGANPRTKNIAVSKDKTAISCVNFSGALYRIAEFLRHETPSTRIFILAPVRYGSQPSPTDSLKLTQLREVANMLCIPFVENWSTVQRYDFIWKHTRPSLGHILILGDSYSQLRKWTSQMESMAEVKALTNLGKTSATLKERGNSHTNTLANQIGRIPASCHPDIILIEGGINDDPDPDRLVANYEDCIARQRRTTFAGALAYIVQQLRNRFPNAKIYAVTPGGLYYGHTDRPFDFIVKANQIRRAAQMLSLQTVDWDREGRLSFVFNNSKGTGNGTEEKPFIYNVPSDETGDLLHPNDHGARYLAENIIKTIRQN